MAVHSRYKQQFDSAKCVYLFTVAVDSALHILFNYHHHHKWYMRYTKKIIKCVIFNVSLKCMSQYNKPRTIRIFFIAKIYLIFEWLVLHAPAHRRTYLLIYEGKSISNKPDLYVALQSKFPFIWYTIPSWFRMCTRSTKSKR